MNSDLKSKALVEVAKNLRDAMGAEDDDNDGTGAFVASRFLMGTGLWGVTFCLLEN
jgi:hypothetical protein